MECQSWYAWHFRGPAISLLGHASDLNLGKCNLVQITWVNPGVKLSNILLKYAWLALSFYCKIGHVPPWGGLLSYSTF